jgi:prevent-host-death family protein
MIVRVDSNRPEVTRSLPLTEAKARLSEVVRNVRRSRKAVTVTVDGEPVVEIAPAPAPRRDLTDNEVATTYALISALIRAPRVSGAFDAVALIGEGRR